MVPYEKLYKDSMEAARRMSGPTSGSKETGLMSRHTDDDDPLDNFDAVEMNAYYINMFHKMAEENIRKLRSAGEKRLGKGKKNVEENEEETDNASE